MELHVVVAANVDPVTVVQAVPSITLTRSSQFSGLKKKKSAELFEPEWHRVAGAGDLREVLPDDGLYLEAAATHLGHPSVESRVPSVAEVEVAVSPRASGSASSRH